MGSAHPVNTLITFHKLVNLFVEQMQIIIVLINVVIAIGYIIINYLCSLCPVGTLYNEALQQFIDKLIICDIN